MAKKDGPPANHAPTPKMELRPDGQMGRGADQQAFTERQAKMADENRAPLTPEEMKQKRLDHLRESIKNQRDEAFNGERPTSPQRGVLSEQFRKSAKDKGGVDI